MRAGRRSRLLGVGAVGLLMLVAGGSAWRGYSAGHPWLTLINRSGVDIADAAVDLNGQRYEIGTVKSGEQRVGRLSLPASESAMLLTLSIDSHQYVSGMNRVHPVAFQGFQFSVVRMGDGLVNIISQTCIRGKCTAD